MVGAGFVLGVSGEENMADTLGAWQAVGVLLFCTGVAIVFATFALRSNPENDTPVGFRVAMAILSMLLLAIGILAVVSNWFWV